MNIVLGENNLHKNYPGDIKKSCYNPEWFLKYIVIKEDFITSFWAKKGKWNDS